MFSIIPVSIKIPVTISSSLSAPGIEFDQQDADGMTALHYAAINGHLDVVDALLDANASVGLKNSEGKTVYDVATPDCIYLFEQSRPPVLK